MKKAVIYSRVSDPGQVGGFSLDVQKERCAEWAKKNGYQVVGIFEDGGKSGTKTVGREALDDMIINCQEEKIDVALTIDTDRIARNELDHFNIIDSLKKAGTKYIAVNQPMINDSPEGMFFETILAGTNAFYSRLLGRKVKKSLEKKLQNGDWPGWAPLGYKNVNLGSEDKPQRVIKMDKEKSSLVSELFRLYSTGNYSVDELVDHINDKGLRSKTGKKMYRSIVYEMLKNPFYIKWMKYKDQLYKGKHDPLTTPEIFETCQKIMARHNHNACRRRKYKWLLNGFAYCQECDARLYGDGVHAKNKAYYHGSARNGCSHYIPLDELEDAVAKEFKKIELSEEFTQAVLDKAKSLVKQSRQSRDSEIQGVRNAIKKFEDKRNILEDNLLDKTIDKESFKRKHQDLNFQIQNLENEIATIENQRGFDVDVIEEVLKLTNNIYEVYCNAGFEAKRHYLAIFFERFDIKNKKVAKVTYTPLFQKLLNSRKVRVSRDWLPGLDSNQQPAG